MDKVKITPKYTAREQRLRNRLEETSFQLAQQTELAGGYLLEVFSLKGQLEAEESRADLHEQNAQQKFNMWMKAEVALNEINANKLANILIEIVLGVFGAGAMFIAGFLYAMSIV